MNEVGIFKRTHEQPKKAHTIFRLPTKHDIAPSVLMLLTSRSAIMGMMPFSAAYFAAVYDKKLAYIAFPITIIGLISMGMGTQTVKYLIAMLIFWLYTRLRDDYTNNEIISSAVCGAGVLIGGLSVFSVMKTTSFDAVMLLCESVVSAFMYVVYIRSRRLISSARRKISQEEIICFCIAVASLIMGFSNIVLPFNITVTKVLSAYAVMLLAMNTSLAAAGAGSLASGLICGMNNFNVSSLMGIYGLCGLAANMLKGFGRYGVMIGFTAACAVIMLCEGNVLDMPINTAEILGAAFIFAVTPKSVNKCVNDFFAKNTAAGGENMNERVKYFIGTKLKKTADAFSALAKSFSAVSEKELNIADVSVIFKKTAQRVCSNCEMSPHCWQRSYGDTCEKMYTLLEIMDKKGRIDADSLPEDFSQYCIKTPMLVSCFEHMYELYRQQLLHMGEKDLNRELTARQYVEISSLLNNLSAELDRDICTMTEYERRIGEELDKCGITVNNVYVEERGKNDVRAAVSTGCDCDAAEVCGIISEVLQTPMLADMRGGTDILKFVTESNIEVDIGMAQICKSGEQVNGDSMICFTTDECKFVLAVSDGMGSGEKAMEESRLTTGLLKEFITAGFDSYSGINMINSSLAIRSDRESFSTLDVVIVDKKAMTAEFIKSGAAQSYIMSDSNVDTIYSKSLPAGMLINPDTDVQHRNLKKGDVIAVISDGVADAGRSLVQGEWIKRILQVEEGKAQDIAEKLIEGALGRSHSSARDDMSAAVIKIV